MFKLKYNFVINNNNDKTLKYTPLTNITLLNSLIPNSHIRKNKTVTNLKTIVLSPFHYKTSKKNILRSVHYITIEFNFIKFNTNKIKLIYFLIKNNKLNEKLLRFLPVKKTQLLIK